MKSLLLLFLLPCLTPGHGHWRCQDGSKANCDQACTDPSTPETTESGEEGSTDVGSGNGEFDETTTDVPVETERYKSTKMKPA